MHFVNFTDQQANGVHYTKLSVNPYMTSEKYIEGSRRCQCKEEAHANNLDIMYYTAHVQSIDAAWYTAYLTVHASLITELQGNDVRGKSRVTMNVV